MFESMDIAKKLILSTMKEEGEPKTLKTTCNLTASFQTSVISLFTGFQKDFFLIAEKVVSFLRKSSLDWDFLRGQLLELTDDDKLFLTSWCQKIIHLLEVRERPIRVT